MIVDLTLTPRVPAQEKEQEKEGKLFWLLENEISYVSFERIPKYTRAGLSAASNEEGSV